MPASSKRITVVVAVVLVGLAAIVLGRTLRLGPFSDGFFVGGTGTAIRVVGRTGALSIDREAGRLRYSRREPTPREAAFELSVEVDGTAIAVPLAGAQYHPRQRGTILLPAVLRVGEVEHSFSIVLRLDERWSSFTVELRYVQPADVSNVALRIDVVGTTRSLFVPGKGDVADRSDASGVWVSMETADCSIGVSSLGQDIRLRSDPASTPDGPLATRTSVSKAVSATADGSRAASLEISVAPDPQSLVGMLWESAKTTTKAVRGRVVGDPGPCVVYGLDADRLPRARVPTRTAGAFAVQVPVSVVDWYATCGAASASRRVAHVPGTGAELVLDMEPGGELEVRVVDGDTSQPIPARLLVRGLLPTLDPTFGPDYRGSGAGPLMDLVDGAVATPLPAGSYRILATHGPEWTIDSREVTIGHGGRAHVELELRRAVPTPGKVACDLHVHARPSFDTLVSTEDRVASLVSAGIEFAVPTEHNIVGDYGAALETTRLGRQLRFVRGVEITTYSPRFGHFGVFPYADEKVPKYAGTNATRLFDTLRRDAPGAIVQVNHPRIEGGIGYFQVVHYQRDGVIPHGMRMDFDTLEVFNGYDIGFEDHVNTVLLDWFSLLSRGYRFVATGSSDSHSIQYHWAGYPRTVVDVETNQDDPATLDTDAVILALRSGRTQVTSGPIVEFDVEGAKPGSEITISADTVHARVVVRAAPWIDVRLVEVVVSGRVVDSWPVAESPTRVGHESGTQQELFDRSVRTSRDLMVSLKPTDTWMNVIVRATRKLDDVLPFMPTAPMAFTQPVFIAREPARRN
jgi:hypothetical protein